ncbi:serine/threonine-protein kinase [Nocardiopsis sp. N85]|uniref:serine/threonine-protein kinase n=1 Tax=Nocardiopsis sp. N85 TaxID=3029400 RepID=UPI00237FCF46|nr:serine/threonine-protein kinase [Nocardiopsis sp. N85]MDE3720591.1 serine/threonine-protein kinase [Nocardiopsis sp. N85]
MPSDGLPKNLEPLGAGDPATIGPYVLSGKLGSGGMGTVYLGGLPERNHQVAIKVIRPELAFDEATRARFRDEMENARKVASFCTAKVLDHGTFENRPYMVTEYIAGTALAEHISQNGPLDSSTLHGFALGVAAALAAIHRTGLVHRDLKPANVLLSLSGPRVIDFGIARAMNTATNHTQTGIVMGSPGWMAPEQLLEEQVTTKADIFAWGCLVAFAGNGTHPFGNGDAMTLGKRVLFAEPQIGNLVSPLDRLVLRALDKDPNRRPTAQDLLLELAGGEDTSNPNDMVSHALHQSWRPNLPPPVPQMPHPPQGGHQTMTGMRHPAPGAYQAPPAAGPPQAPAPQMNPAHQSGTFVRQQQSAPPGHPVTGHPPQGPPVARPRTGAPGGPQQAQHPASTGAIPVVPPADQQASRPGPQPYVPPVPPPPHRPTTPANRRGILIIAAVSAVALIVALLLLLYVVSNLTDRDDAGGTGGPQAGTPSTGAPEDDDDATDDGAPEPGAGSGVMAATSLDGRVHFEILDMECGLSEIPTRETRVESGGQYCVFDVRMSNLGDQALALDYTDQALVTGEGLPITASRPSRIEEGEPLWGAAVTPETAVSGTMVFTISETARPQALLLRHSPDVAPTEVLLAEEFTD